ncbi:MAG TPA: hypothetical protein VFA75_07890 [Nevskia sp.]|nr:hypothetical protein [Nevskia sp.]
MKKLSDQEAATLRTTLAATMVALQRGRVPIGPELQRLLKSAWDVVRDPADPALAFQVRRASPLVLPFGADLR